MRQIPALGPSATTSILPALPPSTTKCEVQKCPWWPYSNSKDFKANTALVLVFLFCTLISGLVFNFAIRYLCTRRRQGNRKVELRCAAGEPEAETPAFIYSVGMKLAGAEAECTICLSELTVGERIRVLEKCGHGFHFQCIEKWLVSHFSCPTCRANSH